MTRLDRGGGSGAGQWNISLKGIRIRSNDLQGYVAANKTGRERGIDLIQAGESGSKAREGDCRLGVIASESVM